MDDENQIVDGKTVYKLQKPFSFGKDEQVTEIELEEPAAVELKGIKITIPEEGKPTEIDVEMALKVVKVCSNAPIPKLNKLKTVDVIAAYSQCILLFFDGTV